MPHNQRSQPSSIIQPLILWRLPSSAQSVAGPSRRTRRLNQTILPSRPYSGFRRRKMAADDVRGRRDLQPQPLSTNSTTPPTQGSTPATRSWLLAPPIRTRSFTANRADQTQASSQTRGSIPIVQKPDVRIRILDAVGRKADFGSIPARRDHVVAGCTWLGLPLCLSPDASPLSPRRESARRWIATALPSPTDLSII